MFRLRKWKNFPYVTYIIGFAFVLLYFDWLCRQPLTGQASPVPTGVHEPLSAFFRYVSQSRGDLLSFRLWDVLGALLLMGLVEILLVRWWAVRHSKDK